VAGDDSFDTSITGGQYVYNFKLKKGWPLFSGPVWSLAAIFKIHNINPAIK